MFPARAGMSRAPTLDWVGALCVPRASGDEPNPGKWIQELRKCSPRERG